MATAKKATKTTGTAVAVKKASSTAVANIQETLRQQAEANASRIGGSGGRSIRVGQDKSFTLPDGTKTREPLELVVVDFISRNEWYDRPFSKDDMGPPACFAISPEHKGMVPSDSSPIKQADACNDCEMNVYGSSPTGAGKACGNTRLLAVLPPDGDENDELWTLKVSPTALKEFDGFVAGVNRMFTLPPVGVVVTVGFNEGKDYPSLTFSNPQPNENVAAHLGRQTEARELLMAEPDVSTFVPYEGGKKAAPRGRVVPVRRAATR